MPKKSNQSTPQDSADPPSSPSNDTLQQDHPSDNQTDVETEIARLKRIQDIFETGMAEGRTPHDVLFKLMMERPDVARAYLEVELPPSLSRRVDWESLQYQPTHFSEPIISEKRTDILLSLRLRPSNQQTYDQTIYVYCMFEHQSTDDQTMAWRFFEYLYLWYSHYLKSDDSSDSPKKLPFVFPLVLYNGVQPWKSPTCFQEMVDIPRGCKSFVPHFQFSLKDLSQVEDPDIQANYQRSFLLTKFLDYFKYSRRPEFYERLRLDEHFVFLRDERGDALYAIFIYILQTQSNHQELTKMLNNKLRTEGNMVDVIELIKQDGREEGIEQGREEGREEGREQGEYQAKIATAKRMLERQMDLQTIADITELSLEEVTQIAQDLKS
jgi:predicted transposase/invertase (TIGR01784 family)